MTPAVHDSNLVGAFMQSYRLSITAKKIQNKNKKFSAFITAYACSYNKSLFNYFIIVFSFKKLAHSRYINITCRLNNCYIEN